MTRKIKFRGKRLSDGEWIYGDLLHNVDCVKIREWEADVNQIPKSYVVDENTIGQYTGLKDKNGKEVYEGDIVCFDGYMTADDSLGFEPNGYIYDKDSVHCVLWDNVLGGWTLNFDEDEEWKYKRDTRGLLCDQKCEVIGNIHDNPELLKTKGEIKNE